MSSKNEFNPKEPCVVCFNKNNIYSFGSCNHPVCYECSTRMRVLCQQNECPICRQDLQKVYFTSDVKPYQSIRLDKAECDKKYNIYFDSAHAKERYEYLLEHRCPECSMVFSIFKSLADHVSKKHKMFYCDLCVTNLKIFSRERRCYERSKLSLHRREGDPDDKSHKGHPLCEFCDVRYMDNDDLYRHLRRDHFYCHFCDADGRHYYFNEYPNLRDHFLKDHFLCQEENCVNEQFTSVFRSEYDLKAHVAVTHGKTIGKYAAKQARKVDVDILYPARSGQRGRQDGGRYDPGAPSFHYSDPPQSFQPPPTEININSEEFPTLGGAAVTVLPVQTTRKKKGNEAFPALGPSDSSAQNLNNERWNAPKKSNNSTSTTSTSHQPSNNVNSASRTSTDPFPSLPSTSNHQHLTTSGASWNNVVLTKKNKTQPVKAKPSTNTKTVLNIAKNVQNRSAVTKPSGTSGPNSLTRNKKPNRNQRPLSRNNDEDDDDYIPESELIADRLIPRNHHGAMQPIGERVRPEHGSKIKLISQKPVEIDSTASSGRSVNHNNNSSQNNMNFTNILENGESNKKVKMKFGEESSNRGQRLNANDFPSLDSVAQVPIATAAASATNVPSSNSSKNVYIHPTNFQTRNAHLFENIRNSIGPKFDEFKQMSSLFLRESLIPVDYYEFCLKHLGRTVFNEIFPELLLLLPNIARQKDLWTVHHQNASAKNKKIVAKLVQCATCGQIVHQNDLKNHLDVHKKMAPAPKTKSSNSSNVSSAWNKR